MPTKNTLISFGILLLVLLVEPVSAQVIPIQNPSFEGIPPTSSAVAAPWILCGGTVDTEPGSYGTLPASHGSVYCGFYYNLVANESTGQVLAAPMTAGTAYTMKLDMYAGGGSCKMNFYGSMASCGTDELLWSSANLTNTTAWQTFTASFTPTANYTYVLLAVSCSGVGNAFVDNIQPITSLNGGPDAGFNWKGVCQGETFNFNDTSKALSGTTISNWLWTFGTTPPTTSSLQHPGFVFPSAGTFNVKLVVTASDGKKDSVTTAVTVKPLPTVSFDPFFFICKGDTTQLKANGGGTYLWSPGASLTSNTIANPRAFPSSTTTYSVAVTHPTNGCKKDTSLIFVVNDPPVASITGDLAICPGESTTLFGNGGNTFLWMPVGSGSPVITVSPTTTTTYKLYVTDPNGCRDSTTATVNVATKMTAADIALTPRGCSAKDAVIRVNSLSGGVSPYKYSLDGITFQSSNTFGGQDSGLKHLYIQDNLGCVYDTIFTLSIAPVINSVTLLITPTDCNPRTGKIQVTTVTGGTSTYTYSLNGVSYQASNTFLGLDSGSFRIYVKDSRSCLYDSSVHLSMITGPRSIQALIGNSGCGAPTGYINVQTVVGGTGPYQYSKDGTTYQSSANLSPLSAGAYNVFIKDSKGCVYDSLISVGSASGPGGFIDSVGFSNCGAPDGLIKVMSVSGGSGPFQYSIDGTNYQSPNQFSGLLPGNYAVYVKDNLGCIYSRTVSVGSTQSITSVSVIISDEKCGKANGFINIVSVAGGVQPLKYSKDLGTNYQDTCLFSALVSGSYTIRIKDSKGCIYDTSLTVALISGPAISLIGQSNALCFDSANGTATVSVSGGSGTIVYKWNTVPIQNTTSASGLRAGSYTCSVSDDNSCTASISVNISQPTAIQFTSITSTLVSCMVNDGTATAQANGGTGSIGFSWNSAPAQFSALASGLASGMAYTVTAKDGNGCVKDSSIILNMVQGVTSFSEVVTKAGCGQNNGAIMVINPVGGALPFQYALDAGSYGPDSAFSGLASGSYLAYIKDAKGCIYNRAIFVGNPMGPALMLASISPSTCDKPNGTLKITHTNGGTGPYFYDLGSGFGTADSIGGLPDGPMHVYVRDSNSCAYDSIFNIGGRPGPTSLPLMVNQATCGQSNGEISAGPAMGGTLPYTYALNLAGFSANDHFTGLSPNFYAVSVRDSNNCQYDTVITLVDLAGPSIINHGTHQDTCNHNTGMVFVTSVVGGSRPFVYLLDGLVSPDFDSTFLKVSVGSHVLLVTDTNGCVRSKNIQVSALAGPSTPGIGSSSDEHCDLADGSLVVSPVLPGCSYSLSSGKPFVAPNSFAGLSAGNDTLRVTDANGCLATRPFFLQNISGPSDFDIQGVESTCDSANGSAVLSQAVGGGLNYSYSLDSLSGYVYPGVFDSLAAGNYRGFVKDTYGCILGKDFAIDGNPGPSDITAIAIRENCDHSDGSLNSVIAIDGTVPVGLWFNGVSYPNGVDLLGLAKGAYMLQAIDANGCIFGKTLFVDELESPIANFTVSENNKEAPVYARFENESSGLTGNKWFFGDGDSSQAFSEFHGYETEGDYLVCLVTYNGPICTDTARKWMHVLPPVRLFIPNTFTPDGDGTNELFMVSGVNVEIISVEIFSRWGGKPVCSWSGIDGGWDGTIKGERAEASVYTVKTVYRGIGEQKQSKYTTLNLIK